MSTLSTNDKPAPDMRPGVVLERLGEPVAGAPVLFVHQCPLEAILRHAQRGRLCEVGGFLLGSVFCQDQAQPGLGYVEVEHFLPAAETRAGGASLTFTHDTWADLARQSAERYPKSILLGWYHTHPNLGVFLSGYDFFIQRNFFSQFWQIALVVDPRREKFSFFQWQDQAMVDSGFVLIRESTPAGAATNG